MEGPHSVGKSYRIPDSGCAHLQHVREEISPIVSAIRASDSERKQHQPEKLAEIHIATHLRTTLCRQYSVPCHLQVLGGLFAGLAALSVPRAGAVEVRDDTKVREKGFDLIYQARDLDLAQVSHPNTLGLMTALIA